MKTVCCSNMPFAAEAFATLGDVRVLDGRRITTADLEDAQLLAIRSTTQANSNLLKGTPIRFVGTATIGTDHMDIPWLEANGIRWCHAPGCNANSVSEYITAALLHLGSLHRLTLAGLTLGIIGHGNVGTRVALKGRALGMRVLLNDPPRADVADGTGAAHDYTDLDSLLAQADIVSLHVPMTAAPPYPTRHLADDSFFKRLKRGAIFINSARGAVVDTHALLAALQAGTVSHAIMDTWEGEPIYRPDMLAASSLATPHIAGHSSDGKINGTVMVYEAACRFLGVDPTWSAAPLMPAARVPEIHITGSAPVQRTLHEVVRQVYDIEADDRRMRETCVEDKASRSAGFDRLRKQYPERFEFQHTRVVVPTGHDELARVLSGLGFVVAIPG